MDNANQLFWLRIIAFFHTLRVSDDSYPVWNHCGTRALDHHGQGFFTILKLCSGVSRNLHYLWNFGGFIWQQFADYVSATLDYQPVQRHLRITGIVDVWFLSYRLTGFPARQAS